MTEIEHRPGSNEAAAHGCTCSPVLNRHGRGTLHGDPPLYLSKECPIHRVLHTSGKDEEDGGDPATSKRKREAQIK